MVVVQAMVEEAMAAVAQVKKAASLVREVADHSRCNPSPRCSANVLRPARHRCRGHYCCTSRTHPRTKQRTQAAESVGWVAVAMAA